MKAAIYNSYGDASVLEIKDIPKPVPKKGEVLIKIHASDIHAGIPLLLSGSPFPVRLMMGLFSPPANSVLGNSLAGEIVELGTEVTAFSVGQEIYTELDLGTGKGSFAEYICLPASKLALKPGNISFAEATAAVISGATALLALRDEGNVQKGQKLLINGASGGVGTYAIQIGKALGAEVTAVCSARNADRAKSLGATYVIDYAKEDFTAVKEKFDVVMDIAGSQHISKVRNILAPKGTYLLVGGPIDKFFGRLFQLMIRKPFIGHKLQMVMSSPNVQMLEDLREMFEQEKIRSCIDKRFTLDQVAEAIQYQSEGHAQGKVIIDIIPEK